jgi:hypothetical protein
MSAGVDCSIIRVPSHATWLAEVAVVDAFPSTTGVVSEANAIVRRTAIHDPVHE